VAGDRDTFFEYFNGLVQWRIGTEADWKRCIIFILFFWHVGYGSAGAWRNGMPCVIGQCFMQQCVI
jgi:hypothetical protein